VLEGDANRICSDRTITSTESFGAVLASGKRPSARSAKPPLATPGRITTSHTNADPKHGDLLAHREPFRLGRGSQAKPSPSTPKAVRHALRVSTCHVASREEKGSSSNINLGLGASAH
jgi:hypothetical protein